ncbi:hypothetical protein PSP31120_04996 [Pandoraea sputorum]|nr:hypothetical protein PSP31120_04996 [Pandoraea sputorum]
MDERNTDSVSPRVGGGDAGVVSTGREARHFPGHRS